MTLPLSYYRVYFEEYDRPTLRPRALAVKARTPQEARELIRIAFPRCIIHSTAVTSLKGYQRDRLVKRVLAQ